MGSPNAADTANLASRDSSIHGKRRPPGKCGDGSWSYPLLPGPASAGMLDRHAPVSSTDIRRNVGSACAGIHTMALPQRRCPPANLPSLYCSRFLRWHTENLTVVGRRHIVHAINLGWYRFNDCSMNNRWRWRLFMQHRRSWAAAVSSLRDCGVAIAVGCIGPDGHAHWRTGDDVENSAIFSYSLRYEMVRESLA